MSHLVTREAPDFAAMAVMPDDSFGELRLSSYRGKYVVLFFYPLDFTFVCPTEIIAFDNDLAKFTGRNAEVIGVSVDSHYTHLAWKETSVSRGGIGRIGFPLVSDLDKRISRDYGVLVDDSVALRGLFLIDREGIIRHSVVNDVSLGRSTHEAYRMLCALQFTEEYDEVCPANWQEGEDAIKATTKGVAEYLSKHAGQGGRQSETV